MPRKYILPHLLWVVLCAVLLATQPGCGSRCDPPDWKKVFDAAPPRARPAAPQPPEAAASSPHVVVYLDTSASMAGYVSKDGAGQTVFSRALQELRNLTTILNPPLDVLVRHVDARVGPPQGDSELTAASVTAARFRGGETDLAGAIGEFERPVATPAPPRREAGADAEPTPTPPPARFHILVTDGVQSTSRQQPNLACVAGSDQVCVRKKIMALLGKGWGASVLALRGEFDGKIYSEVSGAAIPYQTRRGDPQTLRPFYVYVFSPDRAALGNLVEVLKERLRPLAAQEESLRELSLSLPYASGFARADAAIPKEREHLTLSRTRHADPPGLTLEVDLDTERSGPETFEINIEVPWSSHARYVGSPRERAELVAWTAVPVHPREGEGAGGRSAERLPELKVAGHSVDPNDGRALLQLSAQWPRGTGEACWRVYRLEGRLSLDRQTPAWVQQWSTNLDTTAAAGGKTLNLESVLLGLWRNDALRDQVVAEVYVRVGPR